ncbi:hypothetical protein [Kineothrix sedimenti]|uniref:Uncharacterized protein n=1 Tax=Kineothrix sedimenti TaxID=3123317 RepID=A0ABZ3F2Y3_9FIRM
MNRLTDRCFRLGFDDSNKLPSYEVIYDKLREFENKEEDKDSSAKNVNEI